MLYPQPVFTPPVFTPPAFTPTVYSDRQPSLPRRRSTSPPRASLTKKSLAIGSIVFLALKHGDDLCISCIQPDCKKIVIEDGAFGHPAIILHMWDERPSGREIMTLCCVVSPQLNRPFRLFLDIHMLIRSLDLSKSTTKPIREDP